MNLDAAPQRARTITGPQAAARLYADIEFELAMGEPTPEQEQHGEDALHELEQRFPGIKAQADQKVENGHVPNLSHKAARNTYGGADTDGHGSPERVRTAHTEVRRRRQQSGRAGTNRGSGPSRPGRSASLLPPGLPAPVESTSRTIAQVIGWGIGLSVAYLLLTRPQGVSGIVGGVTNTIAALVSTNVDPLSPRSTPSTAVRQSAGQAGQAIAGGASQTAAAAGQAGAGAFTGIGLAGTPGSVRAAVAGDAAAASAIAGAAHALAGRVAVKPRPKAKVH